MFVSIMDPCVCVYMCVRARPCQGVTYLAQSLVDLVRVLEVVVREEIELVEEISNIDTT